ncbi:MAG: class I adenylate-forming enzyme family protein [Methanocorpusculum sp.]|uniref:class I adenylate-forming enzyme family protein n=1 Tax=Methanocorpusculum sp. TaxID=2058474 RepID=UPI0027263334|nr:class I adenylate-forming enzyme family protein [Methanocorpusculum sp.]MDO9522259.1 class I adenylate-forming enzyme family protein [Methanocorpusculum sp.]
MSTRIYRNDSITKLEYTDETKRSLYTMLTYGGTHAGPEATAIQYYNNHISYPSLMDQVHACAAGFILHGVKKGDFVTIFLPNIPQSVIAAYAINRIGAICNLVHPLSTGDELRYAVELTESKVVLTFELNEEHCSDLNVEVIRCKTPAYFPSGIKGRIMKTVYNHTVRHAKKTTGKASEWDALLAEGRESLKTTPLPPHDVRAEDTAVIMYTGGTTGPSKGVMLSNSAENYLATELISDYVQGNPHIGDGFLAVLPIFHAFGLTVCIHTPLASGMRVLLCPKFDAKECAGLIVKEKMAFLCGVPAMYERMYPYLKGKDLSCVKHLVCGGDRVTLDLAYRYNDILGREHGGAEFRPGYGLTEAGGACVITDVHYASLYEGGVGVPFKGTEICVVVPGTTDVLPNTEEGELCMIGPAVMTGYYKNPEETAAVLRKHADGRVWLHTGDIVSIGEGDNINFRCRYKRLVKVNGYNVYPLMIEAVMEKCPVISQSCAMGIPWKADTRIKLYVTLSKKMDPEAAIKDIIAFAKANLNHWSVPVSISILDKMPLTKMNKTDYKALEKHE